MTVVQLLTDLKEKTDVDNIYLEPNEEYDMWFFYNLSNYSSDNTYYVKGNFQNYNDNNSYNGYLIELNDLTEID